MSNTRSLPFVLACALALLVAGPALAGDDMTPPWGDDGPQLTFGPEAQGTVYLDYKAQFRMTGRDTGAGFDGDDTSTSYGFRRNRLALRGGWADKLSIYVQSEFADESNLGILGVGNGTSSDVDFQLLDAALRFDFNPAFKVTLGKFKYNLSRENLEACEEPLTLDRSPFLRVPFVSTRDTGIAFWGNLLDDRFQYRLDVMEGRKAASGLIAPGSSFRYGGRAHVSLLEPETGYGYRGTYLGQKKVLTVGGAYQFEPDATYVDTVQRLGKKDYRAWTVDGFFEYPFGKAGTATLSAAYEKTDLDDAYQGATPDANAIGLFGEKNGWYAKGGYMLPNTPVQVFGRVEKWRFAMLSNVYDQVVDWYGVGANYYFWGQNLKLTAEFNRTTFDREGTFTGPQGAGVESSNFNTFVTQLQLIF